MTCNRKHRKKYIQKLIKTVCSQKQHNEVTI